MKNTLLKPIISKHMRIVLAIMLTIVLLLFIAVLLQPRALLLAGAALKTTTVTCADISEVSSEECDALKALYDSTDGKEWLFAKNWFQSPEPCTWFGVICSGDEPQKHINELSLSNNGMKGSLPGKISQLKYLTRLSLQSNQINGTIPVELSSLDRLTWLDLSQNQLAGQIPPGLGLIKNLEILSLSYNQLSDSIPPELGKLTGLRILYLNFNQLDGTIPIELGKCIELQQLYLSGNHLTGAIPPELGNLTNLVSLNLEANELTGALPKELGKLENLERLFVQDNHLTGELPKELSAASKLTSFVVSSNAFSGIIPGSYTALTELSSENGQYVDFSYNMLTTDDVGLSNFLAQCNPGWQNTQTVPPQDMTAQSTSNGVRLTWSPIAYQSNSGYYEISYSTSHDGPYKVHGKTTDKSVAYYLVDDLNVDQEYYFQIRSYTPPHPSQKNELWSIYTPPIRIQYTGQMSTDINALQHPIFLPLVRK